MTAAGAADPSEPGFGLYLHWPFCRSKCPYCDFNSRPGLPEDQARWGRALLTELAHYARLTPGRRLSSIFFGGGTPSLMAPTLVARLIEVAAGHWAFDPAIEITLEANPTSAEVGRFEGFRSAGVNRLSLGVQALEPEALQRLGRQHSLAEAEAALALAARLFERWSFDLIYARPGQSLADWRHELGRALSLAGGHLSLYQLTIEPGTAFHPAWERGELVLPAEERAAALFELTQELTAAAGLPAYEISNHARADQASRHNLTYWRYGDYLGVGPGAHGRITLNGGKQATEAEREPQRWLALVEQQGYGASAPPQPLDAETRLAERLMMGLRLHEGVDLAALAHDLGQGLEHWLDPAALARLEAGGWLERTPERLRATARGRQCLNAVLARLL